MLLDCLFLAGVRFLGVTVPFIVPEALPFRVQCPAEDGPDSACSSQDDLGC